MEIWTSLLALPLVFCYFLGGGVLPKSSSTQPSAIPCMRVCEVRVKMKFLEA